MNIHAPDPQILPKTNIPPVYGPIRTKIQMTTNNSNNTFNRKLLPFVIAFFIITGGFIFFEYQTKTSKLQNRAKLTTESERPIPKQEITPIPLATESAFINFEQTVDRMKEIIQNSNLIYPSVSPPIFELSLGFSK